MPLSEADTKANSLDPGLHSHGWTKSLIEREEIAGTIEIIAGIPRQRAAGRADCALRLRGTGGKQLITVTVLEAQVFSETKRWMF